MPKNILRWRALPVGCDDAFVYLSVMPSMSLEPESAGPLSQHSTWKMLQDWPSFVRQNLEGFRVTVADCEAWELSSPKGDHPKQPTAKTTHSLESERRFADEGSQRHRAATLIWKELFDDAELPPLKVAESARVMLADASGKVMAPATDSSTKPVVEIRTVPAASMQTSLAQFHADSIAAGLPSLTSPVASSQRWIFAEAEVEATTKQMKDITSAIGSPPANARAASSKARLHSFLDAFAEPPPPSPESTATAALAAAAVRAADEIVPGAIGVPAAAIANIAVKPAAAGKQGPTAPQPAPPQTAVPVTSLPAPPASLLEFRDKAGLQRAIGQYKSIYQIAPSQSAEKQDRAVSSDIKLAGNAKGIVAIDASASDREKVDRLFHQRFAKAMALSGLLPLLGLSIEIKIRRSDFEAATKPFKNPVIRAVPQWGADKSALVGSLFDEQVFFTAVDYRNDSNLFLARPALLNTERFMGGFLNLRCASSAGSKAPSFSLYNADGDGMVEACIRFAEETRRIWGERGAEAAEKEAVSLLPTFRSPGITLAQNADDLVALVGEKAKYSAILGSKEYAGSRNAVLTAEQFILGYRIDIQSNRPSDSNWHSLCTRDTTYSVPDVQAIRIPEAFADREHAFVTTIAKVGGDGSNATRDARVELCVFDGWSFAVPRPRVVRRERSSGEKASRDVGAWELSFDSDVVIVNRLCSKSTLLKDMVVPDLRVGTGYRYGARLVYANGWSIPMQVRASDRYATSLGDENEVQRAGIAAANHFFVFRRYEPLLPPDVYFDAAVPIIGPGEQLDRLVVGSPHQVTDGTSGPPRKSRRYLLPSKVAPYTAELNGGFDAPAGVRSRALRHVQFGGSMRVSSEPRGLPIDKSMAIKYAGAETNANSQDYFPDPLVRRLAGMLIAETVSGTEVSKVETRFAEQSFYETGTALIGPDLFRLELGTLDSPTASERYEMRWEEGYFGEFNIGPKIKVLKVALAPAEVVTLRLWSKPDRPDDLEKFAVFANVWSSKEHPFTFLQDLRAAMSAGPCDALNPYRDVTLVHAVPRPLKPPKFSPSFSVCRDDKCEGGGAGSTYAHLSGEVELHRNSTGKVDLYCTWKEVVDDIRLPSPQYDEPSQHIGAIEHIDYCHARGDRVSLDKDDKGTPRKLLQTFADTRYRHVTYWLEAVTRFQSYFVNGHPNARDVGEKTQHGAVFVVRGPESVSIHVPSTRRPDSPQILKILPLFRWQKAQSAKRGKLQSVSESRKSGFRVILDRPWFSSGEGELLALVCWPPALFAHRSSAENGGWRLLRPRHKDADLDFKAVEPFITRWGGDPIRLGPAVSDLPPAQIFSGHVATGSGLLLAEFDGEGSDIEGSQAGRRVSVAGYSVLYSDETRTWYADIDVDMPEIAPSFPFFRLALARYQPHSLPGLELSPVIIANILQLPSARTASIVFHATDERVLTAAVRGSGYRRADSDSFTDKQDAKGAPYREGGALPTARAIRVEIRLEKALKVDGYSFQATIWVPERDADGHDITFSASPGTGDYEDFNIEQRIVLPEPRSRRRYSLVIVEREIWDADAFDENGKTAPNPTKVDDTRIPYVTRIELNPLADHEMAQSVVGSTYEDS